MYQAQIPLRACCYIVSKRYATGGAVASVGHLRNCRNILILLEWRWSRVHWNILGNLGSGMIGVKLTLTFVPSMLSKALRCRN